MSEYVIELEYTSNSNKAAKLKIHEIDGKVIFKGDAVLPEWLHETDQYIPNLELKLFVPEEYSHENIYADSQVINQYRKLFSNSYIETYLDTSIVVKKTAFYSDDGSRAIGFDEAITLPFEVFILLKNILADPVNTLNLMAKQTFMLFGQKPCERIHGADFEQYKLLGQKIEYEEAAIKAKQKEELIKKSLISQATAEVKVTQTVEAQEVSTIKKKDDDAFDVMYMIAFPDAAPFCNPISGLASMIYFSNPYNQEEFVSDPINCLNEIKGFEDIKSCDIDITTIDDEDSYQIDLYSDENKTKESHLGTIHYDAEKGLIIKDSNGNTVIVTEIENIPGCNIVITAKNSSKALIQVVQDINNEFVGNWTIETEDSIRVASSFKIEQDLTLSSDTSKTINFEEITINNVLNVDIFFASSADE